MKPGVASINGSACFNAASNAGPCPGLIDRIADSMITGSLQRRADLFRDGLKRIRVGHRFAVQFQIEACAARQVMEVGMEYALSCRFSVQLHQHDSWAIVCLPDRLR